jgi:hypothetical protein
MSCQQPELAGGELVVGSVGAHRRVASFGRGRAGWVPAPPDYSPLTLFPIPARRGAKMAVGFHDDDLESDVAPVWPTVLAQLT